jgi:hypothetical protein
MRPQTAGWGLLYLLKVIKIRNYLSHHLSVPAREVRRDMPGRTIISW